MSGVTHVLDEAQSPPDADIWVMWCGASCFLLADGQTVPGVDFIAEQWSAKSTCPGCRRQLGLPALEHGRTVLA